MAGNTNEEQHFAVKILIYMSGVIIGLGAKLAMINNESRLTWKQVIYHSMVAFACAWCMWYAFQSIGRPDLATWAAVICGRFGDNVLMVIWDGFKKFLGKINEDINQVK